MKVLSPSQMRQVDLAAHAHWGMDSILLMENAAQALSVLLYSALKKHSLKAVFILCGPGNNGGDGMALARLLHCQGVPVTLCLLLNKDKLSPESGKQFELIHKLKIPRVEAADLTHFPSDCLIVDGLLGSGLNRPPSGEILRIIQLINQSDNYTLSIDIPSGVDGATGLIAPHAVKADMTLCLGCPAPGNLLFPGFSAQGELYQGSISLPPDLIGESPFAAQCLEFPELPPIPRDSYKGSRGYGLVIGGSGTYRGAPRFSALGFIRSGGGYVHLAAPGAVIDSAAASEPEFIMHSLGSLDRSIITPEDLPELIGLLDGKQWVILGPGLGRAPETGVLVRKLLAQCLKPLILDGDGLFHLKNHLHLLKDHQGPLVLTPHIGEAAGLLNSSIENLQSDIMKAALELAEKTKSWVILKQPHSLLAGPQGELFINLSGSPCLATAGSGDLLNGIIASMLGLKLSLKDACLAAMMIHGLTGEVTEQRLGLEGARISDLLQSLPEALGRYRKQQPLWKKEGNNRLKFLYHL